MVFVNEIAEIVHSEVDKYKGAANKNIGDAFLLVWKFKESEYKEEGGELVLEKTYRVSCVSDFSIISFIKIIAEIKLSYEMQKYNKNPLIRQKFPNF